MKVQIIVDSTVDMPEHSRSACRVVPLTVHFGEESFIDGVTLNKQDFYRRLAEGGALPTTSQATPAAFQSVFDEVTRAGDSAVVITLASQFSGTYQSACIAAEDYENIYVVDSRTAAIGSGILAEYALRCAEQGMEAGALAALLEKKREDVRLFALLDTLEYLKRGGRISKTVAFAGGLLNIKPLITVEHGEVLVVGKAQGAKQGMALLTEKLLSDGGINFDLPILLGYSGTDASNLEKYRADSREIWQGREDTLPSTLLCSVIGTHTGPGVVAAACFKND